MSKELLFFYAGLVLTYPVWGTVVAAFLTRPLSKRGRGLLWGTHFIWAGLVAFGWCAAAFGSPHAAGEFPSPQTLGGAIIENLPLVKAAGGWFVAGNVITLILMVIMTHGETIQGDEGGEIILGMIIGTLFATLVIYFGWQAIVFIGGVIAGAAEALWRNF